MCNKNKINSIKKVKDCEVVRVDWKQLKFWVSEGIFLFPLHRYWGKREDFFFLITDNPQNTIFITFHYGLQQAAIKLVSHSMWSSTASYPHSTIACCISFGIQTWHHNTNLADHTRGLSMGAFGAKLYKGYLKGWLYVHYSTKWSNLVLCVDVLKSCYDGTSNFTSKMGDQAGKNGKKRIGQTHS